MSACNTNTALLQYRMKCNLNYPPFQIVTWYSPNVPDFVGTLSGYAPNELLNIAIDGQPLSLASAVQYNQPTGPASGDLMNCYPSPTVVGIDGIPINPTETPLNGQGLLYNATDGYLEWTSAAGGGFSPSGDLSGTNVLQKVIGIDGYTISGNPSNGQSLVYSSSGSNLVWQTSASSTNLVMGMATLLPTLSSQTVFVDGYAAHNDAGLSGQGSFAWNPTYTGPHDALNIYPTGHTTGAWQRQIGPDCLVNVTWFGATGNGVTDDTANIQLCINTCTRQNYGLYFPSLTGNSGVTTYLISKPLFLGGSGAAQGIAVEVRMAEGAQITVAPGLCLPAMVSALQLPAPTYGVQNGLTYVELPITNSSDGGYHLAMVPAANNINNWGDGYVAHLTQSFTQPSSGGSVNNISVSSTANYLSVNFVYIQNAGYYILTVVDTTHVNLELLQQILSTDTATGGTVPSGAGISVNAVVGGLVNNAGPGFTFECFVDPITNLAQGSYVYLASSAGKLGTKYTQTSAFDVLLYNDQVSAQTRIQFTLNTPGSPVTISGLTHTLPAGTLTHIACTYDGVSTMSLYIAGVRVATASQTGGIVQGFYEQIIIGSGGINEDSYPSIQLGGFLPQAVKIAGIRLCAIAAYSGASFTPPTSAPGGIGRIPSTCIDFAQQQTVIGPGGLNFGQGWILATTPNLNYSNTGVPTWLPSKISLTANNTAYIQGPRLTNCNINSALGVCFYAIAATNGVLENCFFTSNIACATLAGFSYNWRIQNCYMKSGNSTNTGYSWCLGVLDGSQFCVIDGGFYEGGMFNIATNVFAGIMISNIYHEVTANGGILLGASYSSGSTAPSASVRDCFFQSDAGTSSTSTQVTNSIYAYNIACVVIEGGYAAGSLPQAPALVIDSCESVDINGLWFLRPEQEYVSGFIGATHMLEIYNQTIPVSINSVQGGWPIPTTGYTAVDVVNGDANVVLSNLIFQSTILVGSNVQFSTQPNTTYRITSIFTGVSTQTWTLHTPYSGASNTDAVANAIGISWIPEDGYAGQGPLTINKQEIFGTNTVNMIAAGGMTLLVNDFLYGTIIFTDTNTLLSGGVTIVTPTIVGYQRRFINQTAQTLTISDGAGTTVAITAGTVARALLLSTGWLAD